MNKVHLNFNMFKQQQCGLMTNKGAICELIIEQFV